MVSPADTLAVLVAAETPAAGNAEGFLVAVFLAEELLVAVFLAADMLEGDPAACPGGILAGRLEVCWVELLAAFQADTWVEYLLVVLMGVFSVVWWGGILVLF